MMILFYLNDDLQKYESPPVGYLVSMDLIFKDRLCFQMKDLEEKV